MFTIFLKKNEIKKQNKFGHKFKTGFYRFYLITTVKH